MSSHTIIYLDQNYLSNMAKARIGNIKNAEAEFWLSLFDDLKKAVLADKIACPESSFHENEAMFDKRIRRPLIDVIIELSWELKFRHWKSILEAQIEDAARKFMNKQPSKRKERRIAFESDPNAPVKSRMKDLRGIEYRKLGRFFIPDEFVEQDRAIKTGFAVRAQETLKQYFDKPLDGPEILLDYKKSVVSGYMGGYALQSIVRRMLERSFLERESAKSKLYDLYTLYHRLRQIGIDTNDSKLLTGFLNSKELLDSPFIDINASIWTAIAQCYQQGRRPKSGDNYDAAILATVLPYCDVVTADNFMKDILTKKTNLAETYHARIFSATKADRLKFQNLVRELS